MRAVQVSRELAAGCRAAGSRGQILFPPQAPLKLFPDQYACTPPSHPGAPVRAGVHLLLYLKENTHSRAATPTDGQTANLCPADHGEQDAPETARAAPSSSSSPPRAADSTVSALHTLQRPTSLQGHREKLSKARLMAPPNEAANWEKPLPPSSFFNLGRKENTSGRFLAVVCLPCGSGEIKRSGTTLQFQIEE
ncbi:hypothetical protein H920_04759 [Fukomys damarensis]|uniref:Uncharacterized protein n=1 Tax=Fukomys damarensis TaxID=885580 RepID=A0A091DU37_FUKDA|nr:hypothetical protein H920_04759 [Fukomys damarensis]